MIDSEGLEGADKPPLSIVYDYGRDLTLYWALRTINPSKMKPRRTLDNH